MPFFIRVCLLCTFSFKASTPALFLSTNAALHSISCHLKTIVHKKCSHLCIKARTSVYLARWQITLDVWMFLLGRWLINKPFSPSYGKLIWPNSLFCCWYTQHLAIQHGSLNTHFKLFDMAHFLKSLASTIVLILEQNHVYVCNIFNLITFSVGLSVWRIMENKIWLDYKNISPA